MRIQLIPTKGGSPIHIPNEPEVLIGRSPELCRVAIPNTAISKKHCILLQKEGKLYIHDQGSTYGTLVNGIKLDKGKPIEVKKGNLITLGPIEFKLETDEAKPAQQTPISDDELQQEFDEIIPGDDPEDDAPEKSKQVAFDEATQKAIRESIGVHEPYIPPPLVKPPVKPIVKEETKTNPPTYPQVKSWKQRLKEFFTLSRKPKKEQKVVQKPVQKNQQNKR